MQNSIAVAANAFTWFGRILYQISSCMEELQASEWHFLLYDKRLKECHVAYSNGRERFWVKLVGVPVSEKEIQNKFKKRTTEDLPLEPDL